MRPWTRIPCGHENCLTREDLERVKAETLAKVAEALRAGLSDHVIAAWPTMAKTLTTAADRLSPPAPKVELPTIGLWRGINAVGIESPDLHTRFVIGNLARLITEGKARIVVDP